LLLHTLWGSMQLYTLSSFFLGLLWPNYMT
jgi:hypothetical protein